jgi:hypothetical protein
MGGTSNMLNKTLVRKSERRMPLGRSRLMWEGNMKMDFKKIGWKGVN